MTIQYLSDNVLFSAPAGTQTDYEALISINFVVQNGETFSAPYLYTQNVTGAATYYQILDLHNTARQLIKDQTLLEFAADQTSSGASSSSTSSSSPALDIPDPGAGSGAA